MTDTPSQEKAEQLKADPAIAEMMEELEARHDVLGAAVFGSTARGDQRPDSDVDVYVLVTEGSWRDFGQHQGRNFEYVYSSEPETLTYSKGNPDDFVKLWTDGHILFDKTGKLHELRDEAIALREKGRPRPDERSVRHFEFDARDSLRAVEALQHSDPATASLALHKLLEHLSSLSFSLEGEWVPAPKERLTALRKKSPELANAFDEFYLSPDLSSGLAAARRVVDLVFNSQGQDESPSR